MERTLTLIIFTAFALIGVGIIIAFLSQWQDEVQGNLCASDACAARTNGETFCNDARDAMMRCVIDDKGCLVETAQPCACDVADGIAYCP